MFAQHKSPNLSELPLPTMNAVDHFNDVASPVALEDQQRLVINHPQFNGFLLLRNEVSQAFNESVNDHDMICKRILYWELPESR